MAMLHDQKVTDQLGKSGEILATIYRADIAFIAFIAFRYLIVYSMRDKNVTLAAYNDLR